MPVFTGFSKQKLPDACNLFWNTLGLLIVIIGFAVSWTDYAISFGESCGEQNQCTTTNGVTTRQDGTVLDGGNAGGPFGIAVFGTDLFFTLIEFGRVIIWDLGGAALFICCPCIKKSDTNRCETCKSACLVLTLFAIDIALWLWGVLCTQAATPADQCLGGYVDSLFFGYGLLIGMWSMYFAIKGVAAKSWFGPACKKWGERPQCKCAERKSNNLLHCTAAAAFGVCLGEPCAQPRA